MSVLNKFFMIVCIAILSIFTIYGDCNAADVTMDPIDGICVVDAPEGINSIMVSADTNVEFRVDATYKITAFPSEKPWEDGGKSELQAWIVDDTLYITAKTNYAVENTVEIWVPAGTYKSIGCQTKKGKEIFLNGNFHEEKREVNEFVDAFNWKGHNVTVK